MDDLIRVAARGGKTKGELSNVLLAMLYTDDADITSRSQLSLEMMMTVIVEVCAAFGLVAGRAAAKRIRN